MDLKEQIRQVTNILEQAEYSKRRARSPKSKRARRHECKFWRDILASLDELKTLKNAQEE